jgi:hypothetical protein
LLWVTLRSKKIKLIIYLERLARLGCMYMKEHKSFIKEFEYMRNMAELKALSSVSLDRPLTDREFNKLMELKKTLFGE